MDTQSTSTNESKNNFINHVFNFDEDTKQELTNVVQYTALAIIPLTLYHHLVNSVIPKLDESKGNVELLIEPTEMNRKKYTKIFLLLLCGIFYNPLN